MPNCECQSILWNNRRAYRLSNGSIELTVLLGGGHIADFRLAGSPLNLLWEAPWVTIDPHTFSPAAHSTSYGDGAVGKFLSGYTGHALVLGYFGMPSSDDEARGLPLHGEAASSEWSVVSAREAEGSASLAMEVELPSCHLSIKRKITLLADALTAAIEEAVINRSDAAIGFQWVQHAAFGEPFYTRGDSSLFVPVVRARTWPLGYEGREFLPKDTEFVWPAVQTANGNRIDLAVPFQQHGTGFLASLLIPTERTNGYIAIHNQRHAQAAGYSFDRKRFPWIALWEENCARCYSPWNGTTRVRGVEFGTSPMPLGLEQAREMRTLYDTPVLGTIPANSRRGTAYEIFVSPVPADWKGIYDVVPSDDGLVIRNETREIRLKSSRSSAHLRRENA
jgi:hypothetical protein